MKKTAVVLITALLSSMVFAGQEHENGHKKHKPWNVTTVGVNTNIDTDVRSKAVAFSTSSSVNENRSTATNGDTVLTVNESGYAGKNTPDIVLGNVYPTSPCMGSSNVGGSGPGFSIGFGTSWTDDECGIRETARSFAGIGLKDDAIKILCSSKYAANAPSCITK